MPLFGDRRISAEWNKYGREQAEPFHCENPHSAAWCRFPSARVVLTAILAFCLTLSLFVKDAAGAALSGNAAIYGLEGAFSDDVRVKISLRGYKTSDGSLQIEGLISKMASSVEYIMEDGPIDLSLRFPASLINDLPGGVHDITASSWDFQGRSEVVIPPAAVGKLFIKTATPAAVVDYVGEKLSNLRNNDGVPYRPEMRRLAYYSFKMGNGPVIVGSPDAYNAYRIPEEWMRGERLSIVHLNEMESLNSEPQTVTIPKRPPSPWVFALDESAPGANDGKIFGVSKKMEYSADGGKHWTDCPVWKIECLAPSDGYHVRFKAIKGVSFASGQKKLVIKAAPDTPEF
jgi:hypothetical protein